MLAEPKLLEETAMKQAWQQFCYYWLGIGPRPISPKLTSKYLESLAREAIRKKTDLQEAAAEVHRHLEQENLLAIRPRSVWAGRILVAFFVVIVLALMSVSSLLAVRLFSRDDQQIQPTEAPVATVVTSTAVKIQYEGSLDEAVVVGERRSLHFKLVNDHNQPIVGKRVDFTIMSGPGQLGARTAVSDSSGQVETTLIAGSEPGVVQVVAIVTEDPNIQSKVTLRVIGTPKLTVQPDNQNIPRDVVQGEEFLVQFLIANEGSAQANQVRLHSKLPANVAFVSERSENCRLAGEEIICEIGSVNFSVQVKRSYYLRVDAAQTVTINPGSYWLTYAEYEERIEGIAPIIVNVSVLQPTAIRLSATATRLLASSTIITPTTTPTRATTTTITIELLNTDGQMSPVSEQINLSLESSNGTPADASLGVLEATTLTTVEGRATVILATGTHPGIVNVRAVTAKGLSADFLTIEIVTSGRLGRTDHLYKTSTLSNANVIIFQLPSDTPVELLGETVNGAEKVALIIWLPRQYIAENGSIIGIQTALPQIYVGEDRSDPLNASSGARQLQLLANGTPVEFVDQASDSDYVRIRIIGWVNRPFLVEENG
jgi:hypothetical protein